MRIALGIQYNGSKYHGWQYQPNVPTVQGNLEQALSNIADHNIKLSCAGRTDTRVHATGQVVHFDTFSQRDRRAWTLGTNSRLSQLGQPIRVVWARFVDTAFHARYCAIQRRYLYLIHNRSTSCVLLSDQLTWYPHSLEIEKMKLASQILVGEHDFSSFRASTCRSRSPIRIIEHIDVQTNGELVIIDVVADSFLHHMVRNIVGALLAVGRGKLSVQGMEQLLLAKNRQMGEVTSPPQGLYLVHVKYPKRFQLENTPSAPLLLNGIKGF